MAHYVKELNDAAINRLYADHSIEEFHRFKRDLETDSFILNRGDPSEISAKDLLWQGRPKYDQVGHSFWAWFLWTCIVAHPRIKSAAFRVGGDPGHDCAREFNNDLLKAAAGPFTATFEGGYGTGDGYVFAKPESGFRNKSFVLEVGDVAPETLMYLVRRNYGFARWPYHSSFIYVFEVPVETRMELVDHIMWQHLKDCPECSKGKDVEGLIEPARTI